MANQQTLKQTRQSLKLEQQLPSIPDKLYFNIGEVAKLCELKPHVLRYWEEEFTALSPVKRRGNRRYYQRKDVQLVREIQNLLYVQGFTIEGAKAKLLSNTMETAVNPTEKLKSLLAELEVVLGELEEEIAV